MDEETGRGLWYVKIRSRQGGSSSGVAAGGLNEHAFICAI